MIPLAIPNLTGNEDQYLHNCITSTYVSSVGEYVTTFEKLVAQATGSRSAVATSSGTTGLHAALTSVGVKHGDLVIVPSFTFIASANSVRHCGADSWLMDISASDWCLDADLVKSEIEQKCTRVDGNLIHTETGRRVAALMPVYTLGNIPDMVAFHEIASTYSIPLIADAACAVGAMFKGENFGKLADLSILSFNGNKTVTCGGGGAVVTCDQGLGDHVRHLTTTARVWPDYDFDEVGFNYRMTNIQAAIGCAQMERLDSFISTKRHIREYYGTALGEFVDRGYSFFPTTDGSSCWFSGIVLPRHSQSDAVKSITRKLKDRGIDARPFWKPVHLQKPYIHSPKSEMGNTDELWNRIVTLPCSTNITDDELGEVSGAVKELIS